MTAHHTPHTASVQASAPPALGRWPSMKAEHMESPLTAGDPLADAVIAELDACGPRTRHALDTGLRKGLAGLDEQPSEAVAALLKQVETPPSWADPLMLHRGDVVSLSVPPMWFGLCAITSALVHTYASPAAARLLLLRPDRPAQAVPRRLVEAGVWARQAIRPGGLLRGQPGHVATVEARLRHARLRATALTDRHMGMPGMPVGRLDMARTWLGFTLVAHQALAAVGIDVSGEEERRLYRYWAYVAHLLGVDESLYQGVADHAGARRLQDTLDAVAPSPDDTSRTATAAVIGAQAHATAQASGTVLSEERLRDLIHWVLRRSLGSPAADRLGISDGPAVTDLMPLISTLNRRARHWQTFSPASAQAARRQTADAPEPGTDPIAAVLALGVTSRRRAGVRRSGTPAA
ncbi:oxygenase MpaB family protein [Streptomyces sp. VNUA24]|uniref:oxygenase MpaB family protein n=1 Tax=Streptomyces sp. VNUA24 TaxID=3031131 RepID=UPI0023B8838E|nr:oxygenase MpaB family protein [Streptomyces sp. VNUA24]WEH13135.1 oxygenase MpaB family protein [Streptomyces sp. VNUA24]